MHLCKFYRGIEGEEEDKKRREKEEEEKFFNKNNETKGGAELNSGAKRMFPS